MSEVFSIRRPLNPLSCIEFLNFICFKLCICNLNYYTNCRRISRIVVYEKGLDLLINETENVISFEP